MSARRNHKWKDGKCLNCGLLSKPNGSTFLYSENGKDWIPTFPHCIEKAVDDKPKPAKKAAKKAPAKKVAKKTTKKEAKKETEK